MISRYLPLVGLAAIAFALIVVVPSYGQVAVEDLGVDIGKPMEPSNLEGFQQDSNENDVSTRPAQLGDGHVVMKFQVTDADSQNDNPSNVQIKCIKIDNLGSATGGANGDIQEIGVLDGDGNLIASGNTFDTAAENVGFSISFGGNCSSAPQNNGFKYTNEGENFVIPDNESETFQVAVLVNDTKTLLDKSQEHTVHLRATLEYKEEVGSFPAQTDFSATVTDSFPEEIWNGGINNWSEDTFVVEPLMPGETGTVSRFTACDNDANEHNLIINQMRFRQGEEGTALYSDVSTLKVYRLDADTRTLVATTSVDSQNFDRQNASVGVKTGTLNVFVSDDGCATFEVEAELSPYAFKGKTIQLETRLSAKEGYIPTSSVGDFTRFKNISTTVDPMIVTEPVTVIGKGMVGLRDVDLIANGPDQTTPTGQIPVFIRGMKLPGLGGMQATFKYDPSVITVTGISSAPGYSANAGTIDNRRGEFTFQILAGDLTKDNFDPSDEAVSGIVAYIDVNVVGGAGDRSRLLLELHDLKLSNSAEEIADDVGVEPGQVRLVPRGDVDGTLNVTINDAVLLANQLLGDCSELEDFQQIVADVATPQTNEVPSNGFDGCSETLDSNDVAEIARLALEETDNADSAGASRVDPLTLRDVQAAVHGNTLAFTVQGNGIQSTRVDVYNLAGDRMISETASGNHLRLETHSASGRPLANGVYLYRVSVQGGNGQIERSEVRKLVILR